MFSSPTIAVNATTATGDADVACVRVAWPNNHYRPLRQAKPSTVPPLDGLPTGSLVTYRPVNQALHCTAHQQ